MSQDSEQPYKTIDEPEEQIPEWTLLASLPQTCYIKKNDACYNDDETHLNDNDKFLNQLQS